MNEFAASRRVLTVLLLGLWVALAGAQAPPAKGIYSCEVNGKRMTSDRPIPECIDKSQKEHNPDGSVKRIVPPTLTADERAEADARERAALAEKAARNDAIRRDRNLVARFPNESAHGKAREAALDDVRNSVRISEARVKLLTVERKRLLDEAEFYIGKALPAKLKSQLDANDASLDAQRTLVQNQETEVSRINALFDAELARLRKLWAGAPAGSIVPPVPSAMLPTAGAAPKAPSGK